MKKQIFNLAVAAIIVLVGCNSSKKSDEVANYSYQDKEVTQKSQNIKVGDWVTEGTICYGVVVAIDKNGKAIAGQPVKAKVVKISESEIKMKSLENISKASIAGNSTLKDCSKTGIKKGEVWVEKEGDLFKTKEEAINYLKEKKLYKES
jgi:hypothetical protein